MTIKQKFIEPVPWYVFIWAVGIASALFIGMFSDHASLRNQIQAMESRNDEIRVQLSQIQTDLKNLDARLIDIRNDLKNHYSP